MPESVSAMRGDPARGEPVEKCVLSIGVDGIGGNFLSLVEHRDDSELLLRCIMMETSDWYK